jgi:UDP-N-acetylmuramoyl-L-alanyl-D-glutamate--2,6-diaminopimelate ligase
MRLPMEVRSVSLRSVLTGLPAGLGVQQAPDVAISGIAIDSRAVEPGDLFVCLRGGVADGHVFLADAIDRGAVAAVGELPLPTPKIPYVRLHDTRQALSWIAAAFYGFPARNLVVVGVTGTDGKTTTSNLIYRILMAAQIRCGMITTVNAVIGDETIDTGFHVTTPDAHDLQRLLARMVAAGLTHVVLETTSHGWAQHRSDACEFDVGVVTNITHEHLDQHGSYESYRAAKARLFDSLSHTAAKPNVGRRLAVLNRDDNSYEFLHARTQAPQLAYGLGSGADLIAEDINLNSAGVTFVASHADFRVDTTSSLMGEYNVYNCLAAFGAAAVGLGIRPELCAQGIASLEGVAGRMERISMGQKFTAIVDFAHTPNALRASLETARTAAGGHTPGRIIAVFGSAGLRDRQKRRMMAETAARLADISILTAEDPRSESLTGILDEMAAGAESAGGTEGKTFFRVPDRGEAIRKAVRMAGPDDIVLCCGKGHEQSMCFGSKEYSWDDRTAMRAALAELLGQTGPSMPYLPSRDQSEEVWLKT